MADAIDPKNADKRTAARYINMGLLDEKAYEKHTKSLPDLAEKAAVIETVMDEVDAEDEGDEAEETPSEG